MHEVTNDMNRPVVAERNVDRCQRKTNYSTLFNSRSVRDDAHASRPLTLNVERFDLSTWRMEG
jgi:hypothetical protein